MFLILLRGALLRSVCMCVVVLLCCSVVLFVYFALFGVCVFLFLIPPLLFLCFFSFFCGVCVFDSRIVFCAWFEIVVVSSGCCCFPDGGFLCLVYCACVFCVSC